MSITAMKQALEALEDTTKHIFLGDKNGVEANIRAHKQCESLRQAIAEAEKQEQGEPVAWMRSEGVGSPIVTEELCQKYPEYRLFFTVPLYTTPQPAQKPWVGLTDEDIRKADHHMVEGAYHYSFKQGAEWAEAKLKEKNT